MSNLANLDQRSHLDDPARKQQYVTQMFEEIAPRYDAFTRLFSYGMDKAWKDDLVRAVVAAAPQARVVRDLACGTGDLALSLAEALPLAEVEGVDVAAGMIARARAHARIRYRVGDASHLPDADASVDVISAGYGLRNFPDHRAALVDYARALRPGGVLAILDFTRPAFAPWRWVLLSYLWLAGMVVGWWWHRHGPVYGYIAHSIARFVTRRQLIAEARQAGFTVIHDGSHLGGGVCSLVLRKGT